MSVDIQTILAGTDFSDASASATTYAISLARALKARLYLLHVVPEEDVRLLTAIRAYLQSEVTPETLVETFYTEATKRLATLVEDVHATDLVHEQLIVTGDPAAAIMSWATAKQVQLIILGTHGRRGGTRFLMGSVAERVVLAHVLQQPTHDLPGPRLGQVVGEEDRLRLRDRPDVMADVVAELDDQLLRRLEAAAHRIAFV